MATKCAATNILEAAVQDALELDYDEQVQGIKTSISIMVEGDLTHVVVQSLLGTRLMRNSDTLGRPNPFKDALTRSLLAVGSLLWQMLHF